MKLCNQGIKVLFYSFNIHYIQYLLSNNFDICIFFPIHEPGVLF